MDIQGIIKILKASTMSSSQVDKITAALEDIEKKSKKKMKSTMEASQEEVKQLITMAGNAALAMKKNMDDLEKTAGASTSALKTLREEVENLSRNEKDLNEEQKKSLKTKRESIVEHEAKLKALHKEMVQEKSNQKILSTTNDFLKEKIGLGHEMSDSMLGAMFAGNRSFSAIAASVATALHPTRLLGSAMLQVQNATIAYAKEQDTLQSGLAMQTATTGEYNDLLVDVSKENSEYNVSLKESKEAILGLHQSMSMFSEMTSQQKEELVTLNAQLSALGVEGGVAGKQTDVLVKGLGMSTGAAVETSKELVALGTALKLPASVISKDFADAATQLAKYGTDMTDVFKNLQGASKATGISFNSLLSITSQFDTFEGAATSAGKLNAILGGGVINSMDLLNGTEEERVRLLIQSVKASGKSFENMNKFERQAIASAAGITDMTEANKMFSMSLSAYDDMVAKGGDAEAAQAKMNERASAAISVQEKLARIGEAFAISLGPLISAVSLMADKVLSLNDFFGGKLFPTLTIGIGVIYAFRTAMIAKNVVMAAGGVIQFTLASAETAYATAKNFLTGAKAAENAVDLASGPAKVAAASGNATLSSSLAALGTAAAAAAPGITALGLALIEVGIGVALIAGSIALVFIGVAMMIDAMIRLATDVGPEVLFSTATRFIAFAQAISVALAAVGAGLIQYVTVLAGVATLSIAYTAIIAMSFIAMSYAVGILASSLALLPEKKMIAIGIASEGIANVMDASVKLTPAAVKHTREIVTAAADYVKIQANMLSPDMDSFAQAIKGAFTGGGSGGGQDIVLVLNDREFARAVNVAVNRSNNLSID